MFENRVLRGIFGPKRDEVTGEWRKLYNEQFNDLYSSPTIVRVIKSIIISWAGHVAHIEERRGVYKVLVGKPDGKRQLRRPRHRLRIMLRWIFKKWGCEGVDWIELAQSTDRCCARVNAVMNLRVP
jgi:hypothetical protein